MLKPCLNGLPIKIFNGIASQSILTDFQKFLIGADGKLIGVFSAAIDPMSVYMQNAIKGDENN